MEEFIEWLKSSVLGIILLGAAGSILSVVIVAISCDWWRETRFGGLMSATARHLVPEWLRRHQLRDPAKRKAFLLRWLRHDQTKSGLHKGEFGRQAALEEERQFQDRPTDFALKPRLYLTGWPCFVLHDVNQGQQLVATAIAGIEGLLSKGPIQARATVHAHPESVATVTNLRHTFRAIQILHYLVPSHPLVSDFVGQMLDPQNHWRRNDGGWPQFESDRRSDLWATAYGVALLHRVSARRDVSFCDQTVTSAVIAGAIAYLKDQWDRNRWQYAKASSAHNGIQIFHEVFECLHAREPQLLGALHKWVTDWLTPAGTLSPAYIQECHAVSLASGNARVAYALFQYAPDDRRWVPLLETALSHFNTGVNSADAAFLLHLCQHHCGKPYC